MTDGRNHGTDCTNSACHLSPVSRQIMEKLAQSGLSAAASIDPIALMTAAQEAIAMDSRAPHMTLAQIREVHPRAYCAWTLTEEQELLAMAIHGLSVNDIAGKLQRRPGAIRSRLERLSIL